MRIGPRKIVIGATTTLNPSDKHSSISLSDDRLTAVGSTSLYSVRAVASHFVGRFYYEATVLGSANNAAIGISKASFPLNDWPGDTVTSVGFVAGEIRQTGSALATVYSFAVNDVVCVAVDLSQNLIWVRKNASTWNNNATADPATNIGGVTYTSSSKDLFYPTVEPSSVGSIRMNFGAGGYAFGRPNGFKNW